MAKNRINFSEDLILKNNQVGIGTSDPRGKLHIVGSKVILDGTNSLQLPVGTSAQRDPVGSAVTGQIRYNTETSSFEGYGAGGEWGSLGGVKDVDGNTYILPEAFPNANDNTLYFINSGSESVRITGVGSVGIGTTNPTQKLDVVGNLKVSGITSTQSLYVTGNSTFSGITTNLGDFYVGGDLYVQNNLVFNSFSANTFNVLGIATAGTFNGNIVGTSASFTNLRVTGVSTLSTLTLSTLTSTNATLTNINSSGISTLGVTSATNLTTQNINNSGITTTNSLNIDNTQVISSSRQLQNIASLDSTTIATIESAIVNAPNTFTDLQVTGISTFTNGPVIIGTGTSTGTASQPLQVTGSGYISSNLGIGVTNPSQALQVSGNIVASGTVTANSDETLKTNIKTIDNALEKVLSLRGVEYDRIDTGENQIGVIAQEVEKIIPQVVYPKQPAPDDEKKSVAYANLIGLLIEAIKEQNQRIEVLENKLRG